MAVFIGTAANEIITPGFVSATVFRFPFGSFPSAVADSLSGGGGDDILDGGGGNDTLNGGDGNDRLFGNTGDDTLTGGNGNDLLNGGTGADNMNGGFGDDLYVVDNVGDIAGEVAGGIDTVLSSISWTLSVNLENLTLTGIANINGAGNARNNVINGNSGNNVLSGLGGNDTLNGGSGNDTLNGGTGADNMNGGLGNDLYIVDNVGDIAAEVAGGIDTVLSSISWALSANLENLTLTGLANTSGIGNNNNNVINGNGGNNFLSRGGGNDVLNGGAGNDTLVGGIGNDRLNGGAGNDLLIGGPGTDILTGGGGLDRFDFNSVIDSLPGAGIRDVVTDFVGNGIFPGDVFDFSTIDANTALFGDQAFTFIGGAAFGPDATAQLRYAGGVLQGSTDADGSAEFEVQVVGAPALFVGGLGTDIIL